MHKKHPVSIHPYIRSFLTLALAIYITFLIKHDTLQYYIAPRMMIYVKGAALILLVIAISQMYVIFRAEWKNNHSALCSCEHPPSPSIIQNIMTYGLLLFPLLFGFLSPDTAMNSALAAKKGLILNISHETSKIYKPIYLDVAAESLPLDDPYQMDFSTLAQKLDRLDTIQMKPDIFLEQLTSLDLYKDRFVGKKIQITGFIYREKAMPDNQFIIARFALQCCSADAIPYGALVEFPKGKSYADDTWATISGTIQKATYKGNEVIKIAAVQIEKIEAPKSPYVYPNLEFLDEEL